MKFISLINYSMVKADLKSSNSEDAINEIVWYMVKSRNLKLKLRNEVKARLLDRERVHSTAIGNLTAIPHARISSIRHPLFFVATSRNGIDFHSDNNEPVRLVFLFLTPLTDTATHLKILSRINLLISNMQFVNSILNCKTSENLYAQLLLQRNLKDNFISLNPSQIFDELDTTINGLSSETAAARLQEYGTNELHKTASRKLLKKFLSNFINLLALLMWAGAALAFMIQLYVVGWAIIAVIVINALFSFYQEYRAEKAVEALKNLIPLFTRVLRDNNEVRIKSSDIVPGDLILVEEGEYIPADARLITAHELKVDNSVFSGESRPGYKSAESIGNNEEFIWTEIPNLIFAGTTVSSGYGSAVVIATGMTTEIGTIASLTQSVKDELSPLQKEINTLTKMIAIIAIILGGFFLLLGVMVAGLSTTASVMFALGIILGNVPEGLLPTVTLSLAASVQRMSKRNVLVKKLSAVETLGSTNIICTDKTGTLTTNQISVRQFWINNSIITVTGSHYEPSGTFFNTDNPDIPIDTSEFSRPDYSLLFKTSILCNTARLFPPSEEAPFWHISGDPTEAALLVLAEKAGYSIDIERNSNTLLKRFPFESVRKKMSSIHAAPDGKKIVFVKGSPKEIFAISDKILIDQSSCELTESRITELSGVVDAFAVKGLRVLALGIKTLDSTIDIESMKSEDAESGLTFIGITGMYDPPRLEVKDAVTQCHNSGIKIIMITGDYEVTGLAIARQVGIAAGKETKVITGQMLTSMPDEELRRSFDSEVIFARVNPEQKFRIVNTLKECGYTVAVTGDGVNDSPALKRSDIGISMGLRGTDVAREASAMILSDDNFASIVAGIEEGRAVFENIRKFIAYIFAHLVPEVVPFAAYALFGVPLPITPLQILAIDLGTETIPALALGTEKPEKGIMNRPPRSRKSGLVNSKLLIRGYLILGLSNAFFVMLAYFITLFRGGWIPGEKLSSSPDIIDNPLHLKASTMVFAGIVILQIGTLFAVRSETQSSIKLGFFSNHLILYGILLAVGMTSAIVYIPFLQKIFSTTSLDLFDWTMLVIFMFAVLLIEEFRKMLLPKLLNKKR
ncbi:MAG TPA: HAD-IC family P-type ATPase [Chitinispirillaceae bacterium]|nr:HAD-IC family P-type ATPase [Chitinispirillaceae bacterium]